MYVKKENIYPAYVSKYNSNCEKQVILLMISNGEKWHYLAVKEISALLRGITSKNYKIIYNWEGINFPSEKDDWKAFE